MDESALKILLDNLERSRSSLDCWLNFWTFLVVVGVALEVIFTIREYTEALHEYRRGEVHPPNKPGILMFVLELLVVGLITLGVAGELYVNVQAGKVETEIRNANDLRASLLSKEAGDAKTSAEGAAQASERAKQAAAAIEDELTRLRREASARRLSAEQKESLRKALEKMPTPIAVGWSPIDGEAGDLAQDFLAVLKSAHWSTVPILWIPNGKYGISIGFADKEGFNTPQFKLLRDALKGIRFPADPLRVAVGDKSFSPPAESHVLYLLIGIHPPIGNSKAKTRPGTKP